MTCDEARDYIEAAAMGDTEGAIAEDHARTCPACARRLALAREIERVLAARPTPVAPPQFLAQVQSRLRRDRWRREQYVDAGFNVAIGAGLLLVAAGFWLLMNLTGLAAIVRQASSVLADAADIAGPSVLAALPTYAAALALLVVTAGIWWWAEGSA
jgi:hypothetical protein